MTIPEKHLKLLIAFLLKVFGHSADEQNNILVAIQIVEELGKEPELFASFFRTTLEDIAEDSGDLFIDFL